MTKRTIAISALVASCSVIGACGQRSAIEPLANASLPVAPYGREDQPSADELLEPETLAAPERSVELRRRSEEREDDPFDLPPV